jgi:lipoate-protein ligase A
VALWNGGEVRVEVDDPRDPRAQMAIDAARLEETARTARPITRIRLFTFAPPGITLGHSQDPARELDLAALDRDGVPWALRPTGGRAIWHEAEWTFSLVTCLGPGGWALTPAEAYARTGRLLVDALQALGVPVTLAPGTRRGPGAPRAAAGAAPPCFASTARDELLLEGRKVAGIAQRAVRGALLQQGSILLGDSHVTLARYVVGDPARRARLAAEWRQGAAPAGPWLEDVSLQRFAAGVRAALQRMVDGRDREGAPGPG